MDYDLVFEGGGAKGMVFVGAMQVFESLGHTYKRLLGTSAGAITASLLAAGYDSKEMLDALGEKKTDGQSVFTDFMAVPAGIDLSTLQSSVTRNILRSVNVPFIPDKWEDKLDDYLAAWLTAQPNLRCFFSFLELGGWYSADLFVEWLKKRMDTGMYKGKPRQFSGLSLAQFYDQTKVDLTVVASDTTGAQMLVLNHRTAPDLPVVWAVRMSMSIPLLWQSVIWRDEWGKYNDCDMTGHEIVDGGVLSNFPIELFVSKDATVKSVMGPEPGKHVLGMLIDESLDVPGVVIQPVVKTGLAQLTEIQTVRRFSGLMNTVLSARDKMVIEAFEKLVARMPARGFGTTEFNMTDDRRALLVKAGADTLTSYFNQMSQLEALGEVDFDVTAEGQPAQEAADKRAKKILGL